MTQDDKYKHHNYLRQVADDDVACVRRKDLSYGASWKRRGGVGAFMIMARKWDRLENFMEHSDKKYDVFHDVGDGSDGTVLAEIRDLRRYLLLVEAELMAREEVPHDLADDVTAAELGANAEPGLDDWPNVLREQHEFSAAAGECLLRRHPTWEPLDLSYMSAADLVKNIWTRPGDAVAPNGHTTPFVTHEEWKKIFTFFWGSPAQEADRRVPRYGSPPPVADDGAQHASLVPWAVNMQWRHRHGMQAGGEREGEFERWWRQVGPGVWALEPAVECLEDGKMSLPGEVQGLYVWLTVESYLPNTALLNVESCPPDARSWFPLLPRDVNATERAALAPWQQALYREAGDGVGWRIWHAQEAWTRGAEED